VKGARPRRTVRAQARVPEAGLRDPPLQPAGASGRLSGRACDDIGVALSTLELTAVSLPKEQLSEHSFRSAISFFDFVVDGSSLRERLRTENVGVLSKDWDSATFVRQLLLEEPGEDRLDGRRLVYACRECLDVECGGVAATITRVAAHIRWDLEGYWIDHADGRLMLEPTTIGPIEFDASQYRSILESFLTGAP
jgi:hypothetical protein